MNKLIDNLEWKNSWTYVDVHTRLLELSGSSNLRSNGKPLNTRSHKVNKFNNTMKNSKEHNVTQRGKTEPLKGNPCFYCKKHNHPHKGHKHKFCNRLKSVRDNSACSAPPPTPSRDVVLHRANLTAIKPYDHVVA